MDVIGRQQRARMLLKAFSKITARKSKDRPDMQLARADINLSPQLTSQFVTLERSVS